MLGLRLSKPHGSCVSSRKRFKPFPKLRHKHDQRKQPTRSYGRNPSPDLQGDDAHQAQEIREAYYKAIEVLMTLAETLEIADAQQTPSAGPLLTEHFNAVQALDAMKNSRLGKIL